MRPFVIDSGLSNDSFGGFGIRKIKVKGFKSTFILARMYIEDTKYYKYVVMEENTGTILVSERSVHKAIISLDRFLKPLEQCDLEIFINKQLE